MKKLSFKIFLILCLSIFLVSKGQDKSRIDSLIIEMSLDPGSGQDFNIIKIYPHKKYFSIEYFYTKSTTKMDMFMILNVEY